MLQKSHLTLGRSLTGAEVCIPVYEWRPESCQKLIYVQSGMHGGEVTIRTIKKLIEAIQAEKYQTIGFLIVPLANPYMWDQYLYYATLGKFSFDEGKDPNRAFPGNHYGSLDERVASQLTSIASQADIVIDLHTSRDSVPFAIFHTDDAEMIKNVGFQYNHVLLSEKYKGTLSGYATAAGKVGITIECGSHDEYDAVKNDTVWTALDAYLEFLDTGTHPHLKEQIIFTHLENIYSPYQGFIEYTVMPGQSFQEGDVLGHITLVDDLISQYSVKASFGGIVLKRKKSHVVRIGDEIFQCITKN